MDYKIVEKDSFKVAGIREVTKWPGGVWGIVKSNGYMEKMKQIAGENKVTLGLCFGFDEKGYNDNMVGFITENDEIEGYEMFTYPKSEWAEFVAEGKISENVLGNTWECIHKDFIDGKKILQRDVPTIEDYVIWDEEKNYCKVVIRIALL